MDNRGQLLNELQAQTGLPDRETVERVSAAVLRQLHDRLGPEADHLEAQLPQDVKPMFSGGMLDKVKDAVAGTERFGYEEMLERVATDGGVDRQQAERATTLVFHMLKEHISDGERRHVGAVLPSDIQEAWERA